MPPEEIVPEGMSNNKKYLIVIVAVAIVLAAFVAIYLKTRKPAVYTQDTQAVNVVPENKPVVPRTEAATTTDGQGRQVKALMTAEEAFAVASEPTSECVKDGTKLENNFYNDNSKTWWFDSMAKRSGCSPACVVSETSKFAEINWRCTGAFDSK